MSSSGSSAPQHPSGRSLTPGYSLGNGHTGNGHEWAFRRRKAVPDPLDDLSKPAVVLAASRDPLVALVAAVWGGQWTSEAAAEKLYRHVARLVNSTLSTYKRYFASRVREDVMQHVMWQFTRGMCNPDELDHGLASLYTWIRKVADNRTSSLWKRHRRERPFSLEFDLTAGPDAAPPADRLRYRHRSHQELRDSLHRCREFFDTARAAKRSRERIDYHAVLLLKVRLQIAQFKARYCRGRAVLPGEVAAEIATRLPWSWEESARRIRSDLPTLGEIWNSLKSEFDSAPHYVNGCRLWEHLDQFFGIEPGTKNLWDNWVRRAKNNVVEWLESLAKDQDVPFDNLPEYQPFKRLLRIKGSSPEPPDRTS